MIHPGLPWTPEILARARRERLTSTNHSNNSPNIALILSTLVMTRMKRIYNNRLVKLLRIYWHINVILFSYLFRIYTTFCTYFVLCKHSHKFFEWFKEFQTKRFKHTTNIFNARWNNSYWIGLIDWVLLFYSLR